MKVLHVVFSYPPDPPAGTEVYVQALCHALAAAGVESVVAAPAPTDASYEHGGVPVRRFAVSSEATTLMALYSGSDPVAAARVERLLDEERPDILHQHALTYACSIELIRLAKRRGVPVVFTYHTPTTTCPRGTLLEHGDRVCDGLLSVERCTPCTLHGLGLNDELSRLISRTPESIGGWLNESDRSGRVWTALRLPSALRARLSTLQEFLSLPDRFVALTSWVGDLLGANGVANHRIVMSPHGLPAAAAPPRTPAPAGPVSIAHLGRLDPVKGTDVLIQAVRALPGTVLKLDIFGIVQGSAEAAHRDRLQVMAGGDPRIRFLDPVPSSEVIGILAGYDFVAVPSQWLETGPLVVLEAHAAGVPVIGSALGGIKDKIRPGVDGILVDPPASVEAWQEVLAQCTSNRDAAVSLKRGVRTPRVMAAVAREMADLYRSLLGQTTDRTAELSGGLTVSEAPR
ncbi:MAG: glycosyltransferase [Acidobacteriota bacterium]